MTQPFRLQVGGAIDRGRVLGFRFDGREYEGHPGDTLASALLANGVRVVARSFKYHRPRGIMTAGIEEPSALVQLEAGGLHRAEPPSRPRSPFMTGCARRASMPGRASPPIWASLAGAVAPLLPAGFYYKTFMAPQALWTALWEPLLRRMAGLGRAPAACPTRRATTSGTRIATCWWSAADRPGLRRRWPPAGAGARVILADSDTAVRRRAAAPLLPDRRQPTARPGPTRRVAELEAMPEVRLLPATTVLGLLRRQLPDRGRAGRRAARPGGAGRVAAPAPLAHPRPPGRAGDRRDGAAAGVSRQRPARHHAGGRGRDLSCIATR